MCKRIVVGVHKPLCNHKKNYNVQRTKRPFIAFLPTTVSTVYIISKHPTNIPYVKILKQKNINNMSIFMDIHWEIFKVQRIIINTQLHNW